MEKIVSLVANSRKTRASNDDDFTDRLSSRYTVVILVVFAVLVSLNQYVRNPISCWAPVHFANSHVKFSTSYCWVKNTYYLPWDKDIPKEWEDNKRQMIPYYQWIPFILLGQACLFYFPSKIWSVLNSKAGVDADNILAAAHTFSRTDKVESRERTLNMLTNQIDRFLKSRRNLTQKHCQCDMRNCGKGTCCGFYGRRWGYYLLALFLFHKLCYIGNIVGQLFALNIVLSTKYSTFGIDIVRNLVDQRDWTEDSYVAFPRVTLCEFKIRGQDMTNVHRYTIQCVLPVNLYNEKIYIFLWYWMLLVGSLSVLSFIVWLLRALILPDRIRFVRNHIDLGKPGKDSLDRVRKFTVEYLQQDGAFLLRLIAHNTNNITTTEITGSLWKLWLSMKEKEDRDLEMKNEEKNASDVDDDDDEMDGGDAAESKEQEAFRRRGAGDIEQA